MNSTPKLILLFFFLLILQVFILNNILFSGYINPYLYVSFVFFFPLNENKVPVLFFSFLLGLFVDLFSDTGGIHALAITTIAYYRTFFIKLYFKKDIGEYSFFKLSSEPFGKVFNYVVTLTIIHHFIYFSFANFSFQNFGNVLLNTLYASIFTLLLFFMGNYIFIKGE